MKGFDIIDRRFAHYILDNAPLEDLAGGFRWIEGPVWMGDANCLLFQDLPRDRTMRWIEGAGISVYRAPSGYANGQTRDRQGRLISCSHAGRCLLRTEWDGAVTRLVDSHDGKRLNAPNDVVVKSDGSDARARGVQRRDELAWRWASRDRGQEVSNHSTTDPMRFR